MNRVIYIGKFQPFHIGHKSVVEKLAERHSELIIVIGGGSIQGLEGSKVKLVPESEVNNPPAVNNGIAIKKEEINNVKENKSQNSEKYWSSLLMEMIQVFGIFMLFMSLFAGEFVLAILFGLIIYSILLLNTFLNIQTFDYL